MTILLVALRERGGQSDQVLDGDGSGTTSLQMVVVTVLDHCGVQIRTEKRIAGIDRDGGDKD